MVEKTVLEFVEENPQLPVVMTVERTQGSKYLFYLLVRHYRMKLGMSPRFFTYSKVEVNSVKGLAEEHSVFGETGLLVLEGFSNAFVQELSLPKGRYCLAETDTGELKAPGYSFRLKRDLLRALIGQLKVPYLLRNLLKLDWSSCREYSDFEVILRRAKILGWSEEDLGKILEDQTQVNIMSALKKGALKELLQMKARYGAGWMYSYLIETVGLLAVYKALKLMGYDDDRAARELDLGWMKAKEMEEANRVLTREDLLKLTRRILDLDSLIQRNRELGVEILLLNAGVSFRR